MDAVPAHPTPVYNYVYVGGRYYYVVLGGVGVEDALETDA